MDLKTLREYAGDDVAQDAMDSLAADLATAIGQRDLLLKQSSDLALLIAKGSFPLSPQSAGRFNAIPNATAALERIDTIWRENGQLALESVKIAGKLRLIEQRPKWEQDVGTTKER